MSPLGVKERSSSSDPVGELLSLECRRTGRQIRSETVALLHRCATGKLLHQIWSSALAVSRTPATRIPSRPGRTRGGGGDAGPPNARPGIRRMPGVPPTVPALVPPLVPDNSLIFLQKLRLVLDHRPGAAVALPHAHP